MPLTRLDVQLAPVEHTARSRQNQRILPRAAHYPVKVLVPQFDTVIGLARHRYNRALADEPVGAIFTVETVIAVHRRRSRIARPASKRSAPSRH